MQPNASPRLTTLDGPPPRRRPRRVAAAAAAPDAAGRRRPAPAGPPAETPEAGAAAGGRGGGGGRGGFGGGAPDQNAPRVLLSFPTDPNDLLLSGILIGGDALAGRAVAVDAPIGKGHVVMFANRPFWRWQTQGNFFLGFNAILNWNDLDAGRARSGRGRGISRTGMQRDGFNGFQGALPGVRRFRVRSCAWGLRNRKRRQQSCGHCRLLFCRAPARAQGLKPAAQSLLLALSRPQRPARPRPSRASDAGSGAPPVVPRISPPPIRDSVNVQ